MSVQYAVYLLSSAGDPVALLDNTVLTALRYERVLNDISLAQFTLPLDHAAASLIEKHTWFEVQRYPEIGVIQPEGTYMVVFRRRFIDDNGLPYLIVAGVSLEFLLFCRHVDPRNDPLMAGGFSTKLAPVDTVMAELVYEQAGVGAVAHDSTPSAQIPYLTIEIPAGVGEETPVRLQWENLLTVLQDLTERDRMDFRLERGDGVNLAFYAETIGSDRTRTTNFPGQPFVLLSPELGRLRRPELVENWRDEKTVVHLLGKGAGDSREFIGTMVSGLYDTPYTYAATVQDIREVETAQEIIDQGQQALAKNRAEKTLTFEVDSGYYDQWVLGDFVTVEWLEFSGDMRIAAVTVDVQGSTETITPTVRGRYES